MKQLLSILAVGIPAGLLFSVSSGKQRFQILGLVVGGWFVSSWLRDHLE